MLQDLRTLLRAELDIEDWSNALSQLAKHAGNALACARALVALPDGEHWRVLTDQGEELTGPAVSLIASRQVIARAFAGGAVRVPVTLSDMSRSGSADRQSIHSVLAVALNRQGQAANAQRCVLGVLYLDRRREQPTFSAEDEAFAIDFAAVAERLLSLIELLQQARREQKAARHENDSLRGALATEFDPLQTRDPQFRNSVTKVLQRAVQHGRVSVLLLGQTGCGKTHLARQFHSLSTRKEQPFVTLNCGQTSNPDALAIELFGFAKKSGFGTDPAGRDGLARLADGGILFIDEINSMPLALQPKLLRLVEAGRYSPLGSAQEIQVDIQIIAASNEDLHVAIGEKRFREDLYHRLNQISVQLPSLCQRRADIAPLAQIMLAKQARDGNLGPFHFSMAALNVLESVAWHRAGNMRGLENTIRRTLLMLDVGRSQIESDDIILSELLLETSDCTNEPQVVQPTPSRSHDRPSLRERLAAKIVEHKGVLARIAEDPELIALFGVDQRTIPTSTLRQRLARLGLIEALGSERAAHDASLDEVIAALGAHGNGVDAALALRISRDQLVWRLRQAGLTIGEVLEKRGLTGAGTAQAPSPSSTP